MTIDDSNTMKTFKNEAEVEAYYKETGLKIIIFEGVVYDVGCYIS
jgi:predicted heme/steroid binding protein